MSRKAEAEAAKPAKQRPAADEAGVSGEVARSVERRAWRNLVVRLAALRGDVKVEALLAEKHPELRETAERCGSCGNKSLTLAEAKEDAVNWFKRGLRGSNRQGPAQRAALCDQLLATLKDMGASLRGAAPSRLAEALGRSLAEEEGPLLCTALGREVEGSRYEGLWISREGPGMYIFGDEHDGSGLPTVDQIGATIHPRIRVMVKVSGGRLLVDCFFNDGEETPVPAKVPIGPFLSVYFEGVPLRQALSRWSGIGAGGVAPASTAGTAAAAGLTSAAAAGEARPRAGAEKRSEQQDEERHKAALNDKLPPGWELRESRSKKGVFYYANEAKGLSQLERPAAC